VLGNPLVYFDPLGLACRKTPRGTRCTPRPGQGGGRFGVFGCLIGCLSYTQGDRTTQASLEPTIGGGIMICTAKPAKEEEVQGCGSEPKKDCGMYDPNCDNDISGGIAMPGTGALGRSGAVLGMSVNPDGSMCVNVGLFGGFSIFSGSLHLGDIDERW